jgi:hypothetical protein
LKTAVENALHYSRHIVVKQIVREKVWAVASENFSLKFKSLTPKVGNCSAKDGVIPNTFHVHPNSNEIRGIHCASASSNLSPDLKDIEK